MNLIILWTLIPLLTFIGTWCNRINICLNKTLDINVNDSLIIRPPLTKSKRKYLANQNCELTILNPNSSDIIISLYDVSIEYSPGCQFRDFLSITTHSSDKQKSVYYCGKIKSLFFLKRSQSMTIGFRSDSIIERKGFRMRVERVKKLSFQNEWCRKNVFFTAGRIIMENVKNNTNINVAHCFGTIKDSNQHGLLIKLTKVNISRNFYSCEEGFIQFSYIDNCSNSEVVKVFCGIRLTEMLIVAHSDSVKFEIKAPISSQLIVKYRSLKYEETRCAYSSIIKFIRLTSLTQQIEFSLTGNGTYVIDRSNKSITYAMKIETVPGWKININFTDIKDLKYKIRYAEYFPYDLNMFTILNMTEFNGTFISSNSFQLTLVVKVNVTNNSAVIGSITVSDVTTRINILNIRMSLVNVKQLMNNQMLQIVNDLELRKGNVPASILKIKHLTLFDQDEQDYACNQSGIYIYNKTDELFGPYCHESDFIPLKDTNVRIIYYYSMRNIDNDEELDETQTVLELSLEFYPCNFTTLMRPRMDFSISRFYDCLTFYEPVSIINLDAFNFNFLLSSTKEVSLFRLYSRIANEMRDDLINIDREITIDVVKSKTCFFVMKIARVPLSDNYLFLKVSINTSCQYVPSGWSVHLELKSRRRIECNMFSQGRGFDKFMDADEGILTGDVRVFSGYTKESVIFPVCYWYFRGKNRKMQDNEYSMLALNMEYFSLDCDKYELSVMEKINSSVHKVVLTNTLSFDHTIFTRSTKDIYITLTYKTTPGMMKVARHTQRDYFLISFKIVTEKVLISKINCYGDLQWFMVDDSCVKYENGSTLSWREAERICSRQNATLVKIDDLAKRQGLKALALTKWFTSIYSSESVVIFIGLKNEINGDFYRLKWPKHEPMIYDEWFGRSSQSTYSYVSPSLNGIVSKTLPQPSVENNNQQCTAMMMQHPRYWFNWAKIPCDSKIKSSSFICERPLINRLLRAKIFYDNSVGILNDPDEPRCNESWIFHQNKCLMIVFVSKPSDKNLLDMCASKKAKIASMSPEEAMASKALFRKLWPHVTGNLFYEDDNIIREIAESTVHNYVICERMTITWKNITDQYLINDHLFWCGGQDRYWVSIDSKCDSRRHCLLSNDDEKDCDNYRAREFPLECDSLKKISISWNRYCDFIPDCPNEADESHCIRPDCNGNEQWRCANKQCINTSKRCDLITDCNDGSDEKECYNNMCNGFNCSSSVCLPRKYVNDDIVDCPGVLMEDELFKVFMSKRSIDTEVCGDHPGDIMSLCSATSNKCMERNQTCIYTRDSLGTRDVCPLMDHLQHCDDYKCPGMYQCTKMRYCIHMHYVCDGVKDCPNGEDETDDTCLTLTCPLYFRCMAVDLKHLICLERKFLCNGIKECYNGVDEKYCDVGVCPANCLCSGYQIRCGNTSHVMIRDMIASNRVIVIHNTVDLELYDKIFARFTYLGYLSLVGNGINRLSTHLFDGLFNLLILDLSFNKIHILPTKVFGDLQRLQRIDLSKNPIQTLEPFSLAGLISLRSIDLSEMLFNEVPNNMFSGMSNKLINVNLSGNDIRTINRLAFEGIYNLSSLDITLSKIDIAIVGEPLSHLTVKRVETNIYKICCSLAKFDSCSSATDIASNCDNLLANSSIKVIVWFIGLTGLIGNIVVILWRLFRLKNSKKVSNEEVLVINLAISDMLLSIYLVIIVIADYYYRKQYVENSIIWKSSYTCTVAGYLATVSNQASATFLGLITLDRVICIVLVSLKDHVRIIKYSVVPVWMIWTLSVASLEYYRSKQNEIVQSSGLCLSYFSLDYESNLKNSFALAMIIYIFMFLLLIVLGYIVIFIHSWKTRRSAGRALMFNDYKSARKMLILVLVFFFCWFPIIILSFITKNVDYQLTNDQLTWLTVVLMPLNSCLNPYMYTFSNVDLCFKFSRRQNRMKKQNMYSLSAVVKK